MSGEKEPHPNLSVLAGLAAASALSAACVLALFISAMNGSLLADKALRGAWLWQLAWLVPLGTFAERRRRLWFSRGVWLAGAALAAVSLLIRLGVVR